MPTKPLLALLLLLPNIAFSQNPTKPLARHPDNPHYFLFRDKPTLLIGSTEHYGAVMNLDFDYAKYLDELARHGLNQTRTFSGTYREIPGSFGITDNTLSPTRFLAPWPRTNEKYDLTKFDDQYFARLKDFLTQASKRGVVVEYVLFCTLYNDDLYAVNPMNPKNHTSDVGPVPRREVFTLKHPRLLALQEAFVRKAVTELNAFDNLYFEVCNEPYFEGVADDWQAHVAQLIVDTERQLPNRHLIAQNIANDKKKVDKPTPNVDILNFHYATPPETVAMNYAHNLPIADDETGFRGRDDVFYRTEAWDFVLAGGAAYDNLDYSFTATHPAGTLKDFISPGGGGEDLRRSLGALKTFMDAMDFVHMKPANQIIKSGTITAPLNPSAKGAPAQSSTATIRALAQDGKAYALYIRGGAAAQLTLDLPPGAYQADWINPRTGEIERSDPLPNQPAPRTLTAPPYTQDIALRITAK